MAMEDAIELAAQLTAVSKSEKDLDIALSDYVANARIPVNKVQTAAIPSLSWWEHFGLYQRSLAPTTFAFHFFSRSIGIDKIAQRDPQLATEVRDDWQRRHGTSVVDTPIEIAGVDLAGRMLEMTVTAGVATLHDRHGASAVTPCIEVSADAVAADVDDLMDLLPSDGAVVIDGPPILARQLLAEQARLTRGLTVVLAGDDVANPVAAETMILAGRADATAVENGDDQ
jgi:anthraniloyl-CoA monooxygenase